MTFLVGFSTLSFAQSNSTNTQTFPLANTANLTVTTTSVSPIESSDVVFKQDPIQQLKEKAYKNIRYQLWTNSNLDFKNLEIASQKAHQQLTSQEYYDWARVAFWAGDLSQAQNAYQKSMKTASTLSKQEKIDFQQELNEAQQNPQAYQRKIKAIQSGIFNQTQTNPLLWIMYLILVLSSLSLGGALTIIILKRRANRYSTKLYLTQD